MRGHRGLVLSCWLVVGCGPGSASEGEESSTSASSTEDSSTADDSSTGDPPSDVAGPVCGDGVVDDTEECDPGASFPCGDDCSLPEDGPGSIEWVYVDDAGGRAFAVAVDGTARATVVGDHADDAWIARFAPDGMLGWQVEHDDPDSSRAHDVKLHSSGRAIVVGMSGPEFVNAWMAAYDDGGAQLWSRNEAPPPGYDLADAQAVAVHGDQLHVGVNAFPGEQPGYPQVSHLILDVDGMLQTTREWPPTYQSRIWSMAADPPGASIVQVGSWDQESWIESLDAQAQTRWTITSPIEGEPGVGTGVGFDVAIDTDGAVYVAGDEFDYDAGPFGEWSVMYVRKLSREGDPDWAVFLAPRGSPVIAVADGMVYVVDKPAAGVTDLAIWALDADSGALVWQRRLEGEEGPDAVHDVASGPDSLWIVGTRSGDPSAHPYVARVRR